MDQNTLRQLVWTDYRLALIFMVVLPIVILIWSLFAKSEAVQRLMIIYWRVGSLLMITLYLLIPGWRLGFISGIAARFLIPLALWFWVDINEEIKDMPKTTFKLAVTSWRWAVTIYSCLGAILNMPFASCGLSLETLKTPACQVWLEAPQQYKDIIHANSRPGFLGFLGVCGLIVYVLYLGYFLAVRLIKQGRVAMEEEV